MRSLTNNPDLLALHEAYPARYPHLLESAATGEQGRYDILFAFPGKSIELREATAFDFLDALDEAWREEQSKEQFERNPALPFHGGWFLYLSYELAGQIEPRLNLPNNDSNLPIASATRFPAAIIYDHQSDTSSLVSEQEGLFAAMFEDIDHLSFAEGHSNPVAIDLQEEPDTKYTSSVERILDYIRDGDVFQANLSRGWQGRWPTHITTPQLYRRLRAANPGPFNGLATFGENAVLSSSPERLVEVRGNQVQTRPIAGTRPRAQNKQDDAALSRELMAHPKERAEHIMLIDLERNDLGRIAVPGSVTVSELMTLESYASVHHIVSNVCAEKRPEVTPGEIIRAVFPGGTITGCPKVRCMEIIAALEGTGRGAYTGSMGYLNLDGSLDLNILIRTLVRNGDHLSFRAGAGIVADSDPHRELDETRAKAQAMLRALGGSRA
ncbi:Para-aminobenzoate synthase, aminase component [hydrothermal vent metagenome]|uniref:Para-aminobenzoate synthase, aminase component n=1 Tax=hydrothermal vent metagenome TaxID=652676 RepID=A0A3B0YWH0_9ZZZZ